MRPLRRRTVPNIEHRRWRRVGEGGGGGRGVRGHHAGRGGARVRGDRHQGLEPAVFRLRVEVTRRHSAEVAVFVTCQGKTQIRRIGKWFLKVQSTDQYYL